MSFPARYQLPSYHPLQKGSPGPDLDDKATTEDFRAVARSLHAEFFAEHPDTETFTNVVKLLLAKIYDERQRRPGEQYEFQVLQRAGKEETAGSLFARIRLLYELAYSTYIDASGGDTIDVKVFPPERVKSVVKGIQSIAITRGAALHGDVIGSFFEEILRSGFKQDKGMYFTHANLVWFMLEALDLRGLTRDVWGAATHPNQRMPYLIDPSCGSGTFLLRAMQVMSDEIRRNRATLVQTQDDQTYFASHLSDDNPNGWAKDFLYGCDPKFVMAITAKVNMVLHGDGSAHVFKWDALLPLGDAPDRRMQPLPAQKRTVPTATYSADVSEQFDIVVSNPPFGITLAPETKRAVPRTFTLRSATSSEALFLERYVQLLRPGGRLGVVVPESLLNAIDYRDARLILYRHFYVRAVVSLPRNLFVETPTLTSLLFAQKKTETEVKAWDDAWDGALKAFRRDVAQARLKIAAVESAPRSSASDVERAFWSVMSAHLSDDAFVKKRGAAPAVLGARLPSDIIDAGAARLHYESMMRVSGFSHLETQAVLRSVAAELDYSWPTYAVDEVGFKLSKRGERIRINQLCKFVDEDGNEAPNVHRAESGISVEIDTSSPARVLDFLRRDVTWQ